ncbi:MAG: hypothetical protein ACRDPT_00780, partial [Streptomycetales bacterium]
YQALTAQARAAAGLPEGERLRALRQLRRELRQITRRDYFPPREREAARRAVEALARRGLGPAAEPAVAEHRREPQ